MLGHFDRLGFFLLGICIVLVILHFIFQATQNKPYHNVEHFENLQEPIYIFWTGGFDSTFRVLQALIDEEQVVQPIYLSAVIDNDPNSSTRRHNHQQELKTMRSLESKIRQRYPFHSKNLLKLRIVDQIDISPKTAQSMKKLHQRGLVRRPVCQYGGLAQYSLDIDKPIELAVEHEPKSSMMYRAIHDKVDNRHYLNRHIRKEIIEAQPEFDVYRNFLFPTLHMSKQAMLQHAKERGYGDFLKETWSCWYPRNGKPCGRCIMCHERII